MFITFEGIDFSGKSLQIKLLSEYLQEKGIKHKITREPGGDTLSEKIRDILLDKSNFNMTAEAEFLLFAASRAQLTRNFIIPSLHEGYWIICDRFLDSSVAYQCYGRGLDKKIVDAINFFAIAGREPDITFYLHISYEEMMKRKKSAERSDIDRIEASDKSFYERVINGYLELSKTCKRIKAINAERSIIEIRDEIISIIENKE